MSGVHKMLQGTSGQRGFLKFALLLKYTVNQNGLLLFPLAPELNVRKNIKNNYIKSIKDLLKHIAFPIIRHPKFTPVQVTSDKIMVGC